MNALVKPPQDSAALHELPLPASAEYIKKRGISDKLAETNGIVQERPHMSAHRLRIVLPQLDRATHALAIRCREFDGTYHPDADQVVLFGTFFDHETGKAVDRLRFSTKGVPNRASWYGNTTNPTLVVYCESRIKALVTSQANPGWLCAGLNGVEGWSAGKDKEDNSIPVANLVPPLDVSALPAVLLPDSHHHKRVRAAMARLTAVLKLHFRSVTLAKLPPPPDERTDWGADDYATFCGGPQALNLVVRAAEGENGLLPISAAPAIAARNPPLWIVKDLIPTDELTLIVGATSCGKTFLTMDLLLALAGMLKHWLGKPIRAHGPTVHISLESRSLPLRLRAFAEHHKTSLPADYHAIEANVTLPEDLERVVQTLAHIQPLVIAIDTVNRAIGGGDENSAADMGAFIRAAESLRIAFPGCAVILVHHLGKDATKGARGHSSLAAAVGAELEVHHDEKSGVRTVKLGKQRDGSTDFRYDFQLTPVELGRDEDGQPVTSCVVTPSAAPALVDDSNRSIYGWLYAWYLGGQNASRPLSKRRIGENLVNIRPKGSKVTRAELEAVFLWAVDMGHATLSAEQPRRGETYDLHPLRERKF